MTMHNPDGTQVHRLCVIDLSLDGWYPVSVACCDRLGGTIRRGVYVPYNSHVEYAHLLSEQYEHRPACSPRSPERLLGHRARTDDPRQPAYPWGEGTAGRYPARVGAPWSIDSSTPPATRR